MLAAAMATDWSDQIVIAELSDEPAFSDELATLQERLEREDQPAVHVVLNLAGVTYLNSSNIAQLLRLRKTVSERGRSLRLCSVDDQVWSILMLTGLDKVLDFASDPATAIASLQIEDERFGG